MTSERVIIGIDPGTNIMGYGVILNKNTKIELIKMDVLKLGKLDNQALKLKSIFETTLTLIDEFKPDELAIEAPFFGKNIQSMLKLGRAQGVAMAAALYRDIPIFEYSPRKIKQSITGKGAASKEQVAAMLIAMLKINPEYSGLKYLDATDGLAVAVCHYFQHRMMGDHIDNRETTGKYTGWNAFIAQNPNRIKG